MAPDGIDIANNNTSVEDTLKERGEIYGDYKNGILFRTEMKKLIYNRFEQVHGRKMSISQQEFFSDTIMKLSRLAVTPNHKDSWHDLAGYAKLMEDAIDDTK